jgi:hypothetical protein
MKDGSQGYDVPFSVCEHGSLKRSCSVCIYQAELHEAREQLNIAKRYLERIAKAEFPNAEYIPVEMFYELQLIARSALDQINSKGDDAE